MSFRSQSDSEGVTESRNFSTHDTFAEMLKPSGHGFAYRQAQHDTSSDLIVATYLPVGLDHSLGGL